AASMLASLGALGGLAGAASGLKNPSDQYLAFLKSLSVQDSLIDRFDLIKRYEGDLREDARKTLQTAARASSGTKDGLITVEVDDKDPKFAAQLANAHVDELQKLLARLAVTEAQQRRVFFEKQLQQARDNLTRAEQALKSSGVNSSALKTSPQAAVEGVARLRAGITAQEIKIASLRGYLSETAPEFRQALTELSAMRTQLVRAEAQETPVVGGSDYVARYRDFKYYETLFDLFAKQYELARVDESREGAVIQVLDVAQPPERKSKPKKALIAVIATLATGFALLLFVFVRQALANARRDQESAEKLSRLKSAFGRAIGRG
ncbi:MAG: GNVR domain-containing protein, partial [Betaproteobacteria bacterium]